MPTGIYSRGATPEAQRKKQSLALIEYNKNPDVRKQKSEQQIEYNKRPEVRERKCRQMIERYEDPAERAKTGEKSSLAQKKLFENPQYKDKAMKRLLAAHYNGPSTRKDLTYEEFYGKERAKEIKEAIGLAFRDKPLSLEHRKAISLSQEGVPNSIECRAKISISNKGRIIKEESRNKTSEGLKKFYMENPGKSEEVSQRMKQMWQDEEIVKTMTKNRIKGEHKSYNRDEQKLDKIFQGNFLNEWKYNNGEFIIERKIPDYMNMNSKKLLIECLGCYHHGCKICFPNSEKKDNFEFKKNAYAKYGFDTLAIWTHELKDEEAVVAKVRNFMMDLSEKK